MQVDWLMMCAASGSDAPGLEASIDALYGLPLAEFTARRNALAAELKAAGDRPAADRVKSLAKPGVTAWAVNQAWWQDQAAFRAMLQSGDDLRAAHVARAHGKQGDVRQAAEDRRRAVDAVVRTAIDALGGPAAVAPDVRFRILGTVESLASSGVPPDVTIGRLVKDVQASGFDALSSLAGLASAATPVPSRPMIVSRRPEPNTRAASTTREVQKAEKAEAAAREHARRVEEARRRLADREAALRSAKAEASEAAAAEKKARARLEKASERTADLERELEDAREQERAARQQLAHAVRAASEAEMVQARTARDVAAARDALSAEKDRKP